MYSKKKFIYKLTEQLKKTITKNHNLKCALIYIQKKKKNLSKDPGGCFLYYSNITFFSNSFISSIFFIKCFLNFFFFFKII
jgi:hypothetical protein